jgi:hypothetical protein
MNLRHAAALGGREALAAFGIPKPPSLGSIGVKMPEMKGMPKPGNVTSRLSVGGAGGAGTPAPSPAFGTGAMPQAKLSHLKISFNVGIGASNMPAGGAGSVRGEPADEGRRQRSVIDRTFQVNDDVHSFSDSPAPGAVVSP